MQGLCYCTQCKLSLALPAAQAKGAFANKRSSSLYKVHGGRGGIEVPQLKALAIKLDDPSLTSRTHTAGGKH